MGKSAEFSKHEYSWRCVIMALQIREYGYTDDRVRKYLLPVRIVKTVGAAENAEKLLGI